MTTWQRLRLLVKLNWLYFKAVVSLKDPVLITGGHGNWYISPEAVRKLSFEFQMVKFWASIGGRNEYIEILTEDVLGINIIERGEDKNGY